MTELFFFPEELRINPVYNTRLWGGEDEDRQAEAEKVKTLGRQISAVGQIDTAVVLPPHAHGSQQQHTLLIGHRRRAAIAWLNQRRATTEAPMAKLRCRLVSSFLTDPYREAAVSNLGTMTPMEIAALLWNLGKRFDWTGLEGRQAMACYLGVPLPWVNGHVKLLRADKPEQHAIHRGLMSFDGSVKLIEAQDLYRQSVLDLARRIQQEGSEVSVAQAVRAYEAQRPVYLPNGPRTKVYKTRSDKGKKRLMDLGIVTRSRAKV